MVEIKRNGKNLMLLDFDNTIMFDEGSINAATLEIVGKQLERSIVRALEPKVKRPIYDLAATKYAHLMRPNHEMINRIKSNSGKKDIIILTARLDNVMENTIDLLKSTRIPFDALILREQEFLEMEDEVWKARKITELHPKYQKIDIYEDKMDNIEYFKKNFGSETINYFHITPAGISKV